MCMRVGVVQGTKTTRRRASSSSDRSHEGFHREGHEADAGCRREKFV